MKDKSNAQLLAMIAVLWTLGAGVTLASAAVAGLAARIFGAIAWGG